jgi:hypothetical protein
MSKNLVKGNFGTMEFNKYSSGEVYEGVFEAYSKNKPKFIQNIDSELWENIWDEKAQEKGIEYIQDQGRFRKEIRFSDEPKKVKKDMIKLLKSYDSSSIKYNKIISEPFIRGRKLVLENVTTNH